MDKLNNILSSIPLNTYSDIMEELKLMRKEKKPSILNKNLNGLEMLLRSFNFFVKEFDYQAAKKTVAESVCIFDETKHFQLKESAILLDRYFDKLITQYKPAFFNYKKWNNQDVPFEKILIFSIYDELEVLSFECLAFQKIGLQFLFNGKSKQLINCFQQAISIADYTPSLIDRSKKEKLYLFSSGYKHQLKGTLINLQALIRLEQYDFSHFSNANKQPEELYEKALISFTEIQNINNNEEFNINISESIKIVRLDSLSYKLNYEIGNTMYMLLLSEGKKVKLSMNTIHSIYKKGLALSLESNIDTYISIFKSLKQKIDNINHFIINEKELIDKIREQPEWIQKIKEMIAEGKLELDKLSEYIPKLLLKIDYRNEFTLLMKMYNDNQRSRRLNLKTSNDYEVENSRIVRSILEILDKVELNE